MCPLTEVFRAGVVVGEYCIMEETTQIAGFVAIVDLEGLTFEHIWHYTPPVIKKVIQIAQDGAPIRIKGIYVTNNPPIFELLFAVVKLFLKPKLVSRIHFIGRDYGKLHDHIPRERLPEEYGGTLDRHEYEEFVRCLQSVEEFFVEFGKYGYREREA